MEFHIFSIASSAQFTPWRRSANIAGAEFWDTGWRLAAVIIAARIARMKKVSWQYMTGANLKRLGCVREIILYVDTENTGQIGRQG